MRVPNGRDDVGRAVRCNLCPVQDLPSQQERVQAGVPDWLGSEPGGNNPSTEAVYLAWVSNGTIVGHIFTRPGVDRERAARRLTEQVDLAIAGGGRSHRPPADSGQRVNHIALYSGDAAGSGRGLAWALLPPDAPTDTLGRMLAHARRVLG
jgi:hypothetical protein